MKPPISYRKTAKDREVRMGFQAFKDHQGMADRIRKTLYYGKHPKTDRPSLPMTELAVEFFSKAVPEGLGKIDMDYAATVSRNACISPCSMILALAYIERLRCRNSDYLLQVSSSDLFLVSMMVASKFLYDEGEDEEVFNDEWAFSANLDNKEVNELERNFLKAIDWNVYMNSDLFDNLLYDVEYKIAMEKTRDRGWCTYTDLLVLANRLKAVHCWPLLLDSVMKVVAISSIAYVASALAMVGAVILARHATLQRLQPVVIDDATVDDSLTFVMDFASFDNDDNLTGLPCATNDEFVFERGSFCCQKSFLFTSSAPDLDDDNFHESVISPTLGLSSRSKFPYHTSHLNYLNWSCLEEPNFKSSNEIFKFHNIQILVNPEGQSNNMGPTITNDITGSKICINERNNSALLHAHQPERKTICIASAGSAF